MLRTALVLSLGLAFAPRLLAEDPAAATYEAAAAVLARHCNGCHGGNDAEAELRLDTREGILQGGERGPAAIPGQSGASLLVRVLTGKADPRMPPGKRKGPDAAEVAVLRAWIDAGARGPSAAPAGAPSAIPHVEPTVKPRRPIHAVAHDARGRWIAVARHGAVELLSPSTRQVERVLGGFRNVVNAVTVTADGGRIVSAGGEPGVQGELVVHAADGEILRRLRAGRDCFYAVAVTADGRLAAAAGYDADIHVFSLESFEELRAIAGHNGAVLDLAFRPDGRILASASGDRTIKLWDVRTGARLDTFSQPLKDQHTVAFSPDGKLLAAGGEDNRIRIWRVSDKGEEGSSPLLVSRFAHEGAVLKLAFSPDGATLASSASDRTIKIWDARAMSERRLLDGQSDWVSALAFSPDGAQLVAGRLDGSLDVYDAAQGTPIRVAAAIRSALGPVLLAAALTLAAEEPAAAPPAAKPELTRAAPRGVERGATTRLRLAGKNLQGVKEVGSQSPRVKAALTADPGQADAVWVELTPEASFEGASVELSLVTAAGESNRIAIPVDDLRQAVEIEPNGSPAAATDVTLPASVWGTIAAPGDIDHLAFTAEKGQTIVLDLRAAALGAKLNGMLAVLGPDGRLLAAQNDVDGDADPFLALTILASGRHVAVVSDLALGASEDHYYRLTIGALPYVTAVVPPCVPAGKEADVALVGHNLSPGRTVRLAASPPGDAAVPLPAPLRARREHRVIVAAEPVALESSTGDAAADAPALAGPGIAAGRIERPGDADLYRFEARAGETWILETEAARRGSPADTRLEILHADGRPVDRVLLQAVRDSVITFRGIDSGSADVRLKNWEEMELNQLLYLKGEVARLFRAPQGPDSGFVLYMSGGGRRAYFDTSSTAHALGEECYIVEAHAPGAALVPTGLPTFTLPYANDDDGDRRLGRDSRLTFTAPAAGTYLARVSDSRGMGGERFTYALRLRAARPDFNVTLHGANPHVAAGSGRAFSVSVERLDGFDGEVRVAIDGVPPGFTVTQPLVIEAGHAEARGTVFAAPDAKPPTDEATARLRVRAAADIGGSEVTKDMATLGKIALEPQPKLLVRLEPPSGAPELTVRPGDRARAMLKVERRGHTGLVTFTVDNLPHGVIVDDIGLNGVLIPADQSEREIFLHAAGWVPEVSRPCHAIEAQAGGQTSPPVMLHVRRAGGTAAR